MQSHELARELLDRADGVLVIQAGHDLAESDCADTVIDLSHNLDGELCLEVGRQAVIDTWKAELS